MLDLITKSKIRKRIILLLLYNPHKAYYLREISRLIGASPGNSRQELLKLEKVGLLLKERKGSNVYFRLNHGNPVFSDFKNIVDKTIGIRKILEEELKKLRNINFAFLFGSYVKGDFGPDSDIDLYIIGNVREKDLYKKIRKVEEKIYREINYHLATVEEFRKKIKSSFFHKEIIKNNLFIIGDKNEFKKLIK